MSENKIPQAADEAPEAQLTDGQLEEVAGGLDIEQTIVDGVNSVLENARRFFS